MAGDFVRLFCVLIAAAFVLLVVGALAFEAADGTYRALKPAVIWLWGLTVKIGDRELPLWPLEVIGGILSLRFLGGKSGWTAIPAAIVAGWWGGISGWELVERNLNPDWERFPILSFLACAVPAGLAGLLFAMTAVVVILLLMGFWKGVDDMADYIFPWRWGR